MHPSPPPNREHFYCICPAGLQNIKDFAPQGPESVFLPRRAPQIRVFAPQDRLKSYWSYEEIAFFIARVVEWLLGGGTITVVLAMVLERDLCPAKGGKEYKEWGGVVEWFLALGRRSSGPNGIVVSAPPPLTTRILLKALLLYRYTAIAAIPAIPLFAIAA